MNASTCHTERGTSDWRYDEEKFFAGYILSLSKELNHWRSISPLPLIIVEVSILSPTMPVDV